jgi:hypothetical protein
MSAENVDAVCHVAAVRSETDVMCNAILNVQANVVWLPPEAYAALRDCTAVGYRLGLYPCCWIVWVRAVHFQLDGGAVLAALYCFVDDEEPYNLLGVHVLA